ncbi:uncharacterized protein MELLADRAFT_69551 [Melampsora larici-populina 98AG31]|uniref:Uncharacterized protein n=1 Tax=Melampsora larici-populina (strain 98AG31 / pathotype 3-4-7) TaxID=747676 RepID=F4SB53_MELLP|nr:uncharacterized protein MELLADRAFT_69551 [Melampsora larici-populina 98AG31]EGF98134.1 hypothetical protein MELLADRAFT_69551 [Melampsora larici-populina 98AG31]
MGICINVLQTAVGIDSGKALRCLSAKWGEKDKAEKETHKQVKNNTTDANAALDKVNPNLEDELTGLDFGTHALHKILQPSTNFLSNAWCFKKLKTTAEHLLDKTLAKVIH